MLHGLPPDDAINPELRSQPGSQQSRFAKHIALDREQKGLDIRCRFLFIDAPRKQNRRKPKIFTRRNNCHYSSLIEEPWLWLAPKSNAQTQRENHNVNPFCQIVDYPAAFPTCDRFFRSAGSEFLVDPPNSA
jgi:hypothetical protein